MRLRDARDVVALIFRDLEWRMAGGVPGRRHLSGESTMGVLQKIRGLYRFDGDDEPIVVGSVLGTQ